MNLGLMAAALVLLAWPEHGLVLRYIFGFSSIGPHGVTGVLRPVPMAECESKAEFLADALGARQKLERQKIDPEAQRFWWKQR